MGEKVERARRVAQEERGDFVALRALARAQEDARRRGERPTAYSGRRKKAERIGIAPLGDDVYTPGINWDKEDLGTGARPSWRDPHSFAEILKAFVSDSGWEENVHAGELKACWTDIIGENIAQHCVIESYKDGKLVLNTSSSSWQAQMTALSAVLKEKINKELGAKVVTEIAIYTRWK